MSETQNHSNENVESLIEHFLRSCIDSHDEFTRTNSVISQLEPNIRRGLRVDDAFQVVGENEQIDENIQHTAVVAVTVLLDEEFDNIRLGVVDGAIVATTALDKTADEQDIPIDDLDSQLLDASEAYRTVYTAIESGDGCADPQLFIEYVNTVVETDEEESMVWDSVYDLTRMIGEELNEVPIVEVDVGMQALDDSMAENTVRPLMMVTVGLLGQAYSDLYAQFNGQTLTVVTDLEVAVESSGESRAEITETMCNVEEVLGAMRQVNEGDDAW